MNLIEKETTVTYADDLKSFAQGKNSDFKDTEFWGNNPNILFQSMDFFPTETMTFNEQINALTRILIVASFLFAFILQKVRFLLIGFVSVLLVWVFVVTKNKYGLEGFESNPFNTVLNDISGELMDKTLDKYVFDKPEIRNPFSNVLVTDYLDRPNKKPAPPIDEPQTSEQILKKAKQMVQRAHPDFPDLGERLFSNLGDQYQFEQSMQPFYSFSSTTVPNDQQAFTDFCYGDMISCKEGNLLACARNLPRYGEGS